MQEFAIYSVIPPEGCAALQAARDFSEGRSREGAEAHGTRPALGSPSTRSSGSHREARTPITTQPRRGGCSAVAGAGRSPHSMVRRASISGYDKFRNIGRLGIEFVEAAG